MKTTWTNVSTAGELLSITKCKIFQPYKLPKITSIRYILDFSFKKFDNSLFLCLIFICLFIGQQYQCQLRVTKRSQRYNNPVEFELVVKKKKQIYSTLILHVHYCLPSVIDVNSMRSIHKVYVRENSCFCVVDYAKMFTLPEFEDLFKNFSLIYKFFSEYRLALGLNLSCTSSNSADFILRYFRFYLQEHFTLV